MKTRHAKYNGKCCDCATAIRRGDLIGVIAKGKVCCRSCVIDRTSEPRAASDFEDEHEHDERDWPPPASVLASDRRLARRGLTVVRFSSGAVMTQNSRGRCEDAPCCGCCTF